MVHRLTGIIAYRPGHFYALCRRVTGRWEVHDDLASRISALRITTAIMPQAAI